MHFAYTDDQLAFAEAVDHLLQSECAPATVRAAADAPAGHLDRRLWNHLDETGVLAMLVGETDGGLGLDATWTVPVLVETGRYAVPGPIIDTMFIAAPLGVPGLVSSDLGGPIVASAADADRVIIRTSAGLVLLEQGDFALEAVCTVDHARRGATITSHGSGVVLTDDPDQISRLVDSAVVGVSAQLCGLAARMLDMTTAYVKERHQFEQPIGSFQAVKHHLADALLRAEFARPAVDRAAHTVAHGTADAVARDSSTAKVLATDAAEFAARIALQCHGAIGYTTEHDLHLFMKRTWALARSWGDQNFHYTRIEASLGPQSADRH